MASQVICSAPVPADNLLDVAVKCGFTKQGEMFSGESISDILYYEYDTWENMLKDQP